MSVLAETHCGFDIGVEFEKLLIEENFADAVRLWHGAVTFWLDWQLEPGCGRVSEKSCAMRIIKNQHCRNICLWPEGRWGYAIVNTVHFEDVAVDGFASCEAKQCLYDVVGLWVNMLDLVFQKAVTEPDARSYAIIQSQLIKQDSWRSKVLVEVDDASSFAVVQRELIKQCRWRSKMVVEVEAYRDMTTTVAILLCNGLGVHMRPEMSD